MGHAASHFSRRNRVLGGPGCGTDQPAEEPLGWRPTALKQDDAGKVIGALLSSARPTFGHPHTASRTRMWLRLARGCQALPFTKFHHLDILFPGHSAAETNPRILASGIGPVDVVGAILWNRETWPSSSLMFQSSIGRWGRGVFLRNEPNQSPFCRHIFSLFTACQGSR